MKKRSLITGITGQDGSYLTELLLSKGYEVHGMIRRSSSFNTKRIDHIYKDPHEKNVQLFLHYGDLTDATNILRLIYEIQPDEIYNLGAQSHVKVSFETAEYTANSDGLGTLRLLEAIQILKLEKKTKFYQASTSELFGKGNETPQNERTPFYPKSPYGAAKLYAFWITVNYREAYNLFACNGILFNHESPRRGETFATRKITRAVSRMIYGLQKTLYLGNLDSKRDWGYTPDFVEAMWMMLQRDQPDDFVIATGESHSIREFCEKAFEYAGVEIEWLGKGAEEKGVVRSIRFDREGTNPLKNGDVVVNIDPHYFRPTEVDFLLGDITKATEKLGWKPRVFFDELVQIMMEHDLELAQYERYKKDFRAKHSSI